MKCATLVQIACLALALLGADVASSAATAANQSVAGIWLPDPQRSERPRDLPYLPEARAAVDKFRASHDPVKDDPGAFCLAAGMPQTALGGADYPIEIIETPQQITMLFELHQQVRRIYMNLSAHPADAFPQRNGHSIGRWDGAALIIDTRAIRDAIFGAVPHSAQVQVVERFTTLDKGQSLLNEMTITDPGMYTRPVNVRQFYRRAPADIRMFDYDCTEGMWSDHEKARAKSPPAKLPSATP